jgi:DNA-binding NtrC family response regulator
VRSATILVVEDDPTLLKIAARMLESFGYHAIRALNTEAALAELKANDQIDLLFVDLFSSSQMIGYGLAEKALEIRPDVRFLFTSGHGEHPETENPMLRKMMLLPKPYTSRDLKAAVEQILVVQ